MNRSRPVERLCFASNANLSLPGSKSEAQRLLVAAALSGTTCTISGASPSDDVEHLVAGLATLGFTSEFIDRATGTVRIGPRSQEAPTAGEIFCGNSGTALRLLTSVAAITQGEWTLTGDERMQERPVQPLVDAWQQLGVDIDAVSGCPPVRVRGGTNQGGQVTIDPTQSSQFLSSLLLVGAQLRRGLEIRLAGDLASKSYAQLTCSLLKHFGIKAVVEDRVARVLPGGTEPTKPLHVGGDWSCMGIWACLNQLTGSCVTAPNLSRQSGQPDEQLHTALSAFSHAGDRTINVQEIPDQFLNLAIVATFSPGTTHLIGAANVRVKECDRIAVMARELKKLGVDVDEHQDGLSIRGGQPLGSDCIDPASDHRVAMAFALAGLLSPGITIENPSCITKSYPTFWDDFARVQSHHRPVAIVGMRGAGKSTLGKALAKHVGSKFVDIDDLFVEQHGPISAFVASNGWPTFRTEEEKLVLDALKNGQIVATGGGAIESTATQTALREHAHVIWLRAEPDLLQQRLGKDCQRPSLTGAPIADEVVDVLAKRDPLYREVANLVVDAALTTKQQILQAANCGWITQQPRQESRER